MERTLVYSSDGKTCNPIKVEGPGAAPFARLTGIALIPRATSTPSMAAPTPATVSGFEHPEPRTGIAVHILGISAFYHDSAACLLSDGKIAAAAQEERFTRKKGDATFPRHAVEYCLRSAGITVKDLAYVGFYDKPLLKFERILETYVGVAPKGFLSFLKAGPLWIKEKLFMDRQLREALGYDGQILYAEHHESHAASAFFLKELHWPDSLGLLYSTFTATRASR